MNEDIKNLALEFLTMKYPKAKFYYEDYFDNDTFLVCKDLTEDADTYHTEEYLKDVSLLNLALFYPNNVTIYFCKE